jgi:hypothetical protein
VGNLGLAGASQRSYPCSRSSIGSHEVFVSKASSRVVERWEDIHNSGRSKPRRFSGWAVELRRGECKLSGFRDSAVLSSVAINLARPCFSQAILCGPSRLLSIAWYHSMRPANPILADQYQVQSMFSPSGARSLLIAKSSQSQRSFIGDPRCLSKVPYPSSTKSS